MLARPLYTCCDRPEALVRSLNVHWGFVARPLRLPRLRLSAQRTLAMARIHNSFTKAFNLATPVVGCPMAGVAGPDLAAAVARAGGLGFLGSGEPCYGQGRWTAHVKQPPSSEQRSQMT